VLYRFQIDFSDIDRGVYETLDLRVAQHPSETGPYLLSRVLAHALSLQEGLEFSPMGLGDPEAPALRALGVHGVTDLWIEIGNPSARKLHKATKSANRVVVYTYKNPEVLVQEMRDEKVHRADDVEIYAFDPKFLGELEKHLEKNNRWTLLHQQGHLDLQTRDNSLSTDLRRLSTKAEGK